MKNHAILLLALALFISACGLDVPEPGAVSGGGAAKIVVTGSRGVDNRHGVVASYKVTVSGEGIAEPIVAEFGGEAEGGVIENIPAGGSRRVDVEAINTGGRLIRRGESEGVSVKSGAVTDVDIHMDAVPIFTNLKDGNIVPSDRLRFEVFSDPKDAIRIEDIANNEPAVMFDRSTNDDELLAGEGSGIARMTPQILQPGVHRFRAVSVKTGRSSGVNIKITEGRGAHPAPLYSGGAVGVKGRHLAVSRAGSAFDTQPGSGASWPVYLDHILGGKR